MLFWIWQMLTLSLIEAMSENKYAALLYEMIWKDIMIYRSCSCVGFGACWCTMSRFFAHSRAFTASV